MTYSDKISVIIPTYNREKLVVKSVKSVLNQTYKNIEVIVVDDGSSDNTEEALKKIKDERLKYIKLSENVGACKARNRGIEESSGKYIAFQDSDDIFCVDKLKKQLDNLIENKSDLDFCKIRINDSCIQVIPNEQRDEIIDLNNIVDELCKGNFISTQAILAKKEVFDDILFDENLPRLQDYDLILRISSKYKVSYTKDALVDLYRQEDNISNSIDKLKKACFIMMKKDYGFTNEQNYRLYETFLNYILSSEINVPYREIEKLNKNYENLNKEHVKLIDDYNNLSSKYNDTSLELQRVLNSKGWKMLEKLRKFR